ncbi:MAG TPA: transcription elongation factor Spt5 [Methylomirabilota bacterium]|nr:transcription elongation factor Spt5 [Methylomirabilota bacterium]
MSDSIKEDEDDIEGINDVFEDNEIPTSGKSYTKSQKNSDTDVTTSAADVVGGAEASTPIANPQNATQKPETRPVLDSKFFAIRTTGGQENIVANIIQNRINAKKIGIHSILILENFKGYIIVEAPDSNIAYEALAGVRHVRGQIRGELPFKDIEGYLVKKPVVSDLSIDDTVEIIGGPFKAMKAKITRVDYEKQEATVVLLDSPYQIPVTVDANYLKKVAH